MKKTNLGFTMMETLMAISLFGLALFGTLELITVALASGKFSENRTIALNDMRLILERIRTEAETNGLAGVTGTNWTTWANQNLCNPVCDLEGENTTVTYPQGVTGDPLAIQVTINWTEKGKASQYIVDTMVTKRG